MGEHSDANKNGQKAAAVAEGILIKTHLFCEQSVEDILTKDNKKHLLDKNTSDIHGDAVSKEAKEDYTISSAQSKLT